MIYCPSLTKLGTSFAIMLNSSFLSLYALHCVRKWISCSTVDGQNLLFVPYFEPNTIIG